VGITKAASGLSPDRHPDGQPHFLLHHRQEGPAGFGRFSHLHGL